MPSPPLLLDDDLRQVFEFIPRPVLARSQSLVTKNFNELAQSKMHICHKHLVRNMIVFGRQLRDGEWRECCLALGDMIKYEPFFLPLDPDVPDNIVGIRELVVGHFSGDQLIHFLTDCIGQLLQGCRLEIRFVESLLECGDTERAELDQFMHHFHRMCTVLCIFSYERQFLMPQFLFEADILAKLRVVHLNDSIPPEHLHFLLDWLHLPSLAVGGLEVEESSRPEKKLKFRSGDRTFLDQLVTEIRLPNPGQSN